LSILDFSVGVNGSFPTQIGRTYGHEKAIGQPYEVAEMD
jgi:hypothetical protein